MILGKEKLSAICRIDMGQAPDGETYNFNGDGYKLIAGAGDFGEINPSPSKFTSKPTKISEIGDIVICIRATIGDKNWSDDRYCLGRGVAGLRAFPDKLSQNYLWHWLGYMEPVLKGKGRGATFLQINKNDIAELEIKLPSIKEQRRIATILDKAEGLRTKRREAITKLDQLLQSMFLAMFGDPVKNSMGWSSSTLDVHGELKNGINFLKDEVGVKLRYLGVGDFKNRTTFKDIDNLSYISLNYNPSEDYLLKDHDILFVRSNGNKQLVGRCMAIFPGNEKITFSGFCIRFRCKSQLLLSSYLVHLFKNSAFKQELLKSGQGANIQNINQKILSTIKIPVPPITQQVKWQEFVEKVESQKYLFEKNISLAEKLISALHKKFFN